METGFIGGYTEDRELIRRIRRYKEPKGWTIMADYYKNGRFIGIQYKVPISQRRVAERMFMTNLED
ncbi:hypothetical protein MHZ92_19990 [Sporosarcina sp. ACRSL]|nr:hypothetical protein [Sporosarcina sp. ACRSL]